MGNRAVLTFNTTKDAPAIYLHWNGGIDSVQAFLQVAKTINPIGTDADKLDKLADVIARHFFGCNVGHTVYRMPYGQADTDNGDNGVYVIDRAYNITGRLFAPAREQREHDSAEIAADILRDMRSAGELVERTFHADSGHGWLAVKRTELVALGIAESISSYSYERGATVYLEEDCDASRYLDAMAKAGRFVEIKSAKYRHRSPVRSYNNYKGGK